MGVENGGRKEGHTSTNNLPLTLSSPIIKQHGLLACMDYAFQVPYGNATLCHLFSLVFALLALLVKWSKFIESSLSYIINHPHKTLYKLRAKRKIKREMIEMEWRKCYVDLVLVPLAILFSVAYNAWLWHKVRSQPLQTLIGINSAGRRKWVIAMIKVLIFIYIYTYTFKYSKFSLRGSSFERMHVHPRCILA